MDSLLLKSESYGESDNHVGFHKDDGFLVSLGYLMSCMRHQDKNGFQRALKDARLEVGDVIFYASIGKSCIHICILDDECINRCSDGIL